LCERGTTCLGMEEGETDEVDSTGLEGED